MTLALFEQAAVRPFLIKGDGCEPKLRSGDFLMVTACDRYDGEGMYILDHGDGAEGSPYLVQKMCGGGDLLVHYINPKYSRHVLDSDEFAATVRGKVVAEVHLKCSLSELGSTVRANVCAGGAQ